MSTRDDARLTAQERVALAGLEAAAAADDPQLAARLRGSRHRLKSLLPIPLAFVLGKWRSVLRKGWWGAPVVALGLLMVVLGLPYGLPLSLAGVATACAGLRLVAQAVDDRWQHPAPRT
jgi:predicted exporter